MRDPRRQGLTRRQLFGAFGALGLAACDTSKPRRGVLGAMEGWNRGFQSLLFSRSLEASAGDLTPDEMFPGYKATPGPAFPLAPAGWALKVGGQVARPRSFSLDDLRKLPRTDARIEHHCVEGWSAVADWHGVRLSELAKQVGASDVGYVEFKSFDLNYWSSWDADSAMHPQTLIAYGMNGKDLTPKHGAPARLYGSVKLGYKQVKYLTEINFLDEETGGYWEAQGYEWFAGV
jgi:DMSO/TMAO reductase YedYZ molybdopterin-dependent catalytic subunit